jgi:hypothetical protein
LTYRSEQDQGGHLEPYDRISGVLRIVSGVAFAIATSVGVSAQTATTKGEAAHNDHSRGSRPTSKYRFHRAV